MKRGFVVFALLFLLPVVYAEDATIKLFQDSFAAGENLVADVTFDVSARDLQPEHVQFFAQDTEIRVAPFVYPINAHHYIVAFQIPDNLTDGDYTFRLDAVPFLQDQVLVEKNFIKNIQVQETRPIFYITQSSYLLKDQENIYFKLRFYDDTYFNMSVPVFLKGPPYTYLIRAQKGSLRVFDYQIDYGGIKEPYYEFLVDVGTKIYHLPLYIYNPAFVEKNKTKVVPLRFSLASISKRMYVDASLGGDVTFTNILGSSIKKIIFSSSLDIVMLNQSVFENISAGETRSFFVDINPEKHAAPQTYQGEITYTATLDDAAIAPELVPIPVTLEFYREQQAVAPEIKQDLEQENKTLDIEDFVPQATPAVTKQERPYGVLYMLVIILVALALYVYMKLKKPKVETISFGEYVSQVEKKS